MKIIIGDILKSQAQTLINTVNCVGVMGKGIALEFKRRFPDMFEDYAERCRRKDVKLGIPYVFKTMFPPQIVNFPTKDHWKAVSQISDIEKGLQYLLAHYKEWGISSLAIPPLGCGNGQLEWRDIGPLIYKYAKQMNIPVELYAPYGTSPRELTMEFMERVVYNSGQANGKTVQSALNPAWVAIVEILNRIEQQPYHWPTGRTIFQKIAYIATRQGLPTGFVYEKSSFGPFSKDLKRAETKLVNSNLLQEEKVGSMFKVKVGPNYPQVRGNFLASFEQWAGIIDKVTDLFMRINTEQAEIAATVIFTTDSLKEKGMGKPSENEVLESVMQWKQRRRPPLDKADVASAIRNLGILRWLDIKPDANLPVMEDECLLV